MHRHGDIRGYEARVEVLKNRLGPAGRVVTIAAGTKVYKINRTTCGKMSIGYRLKLIMALNK